MLKIFEKKLGLKDKLISGQTLELEPIDEEERSTASKTFIKMSYTQKKQMRQAQWLNEENDWGISENGDLNNSQITEQR